MPHIRFEVYPSTTGEVLPDSEELALQLRARASHPSVRPRPHVGDLTRGYEKIMPATRFLEAIAWPRATVRPVPGLGPGEKTWCVKIWHQPGVPVRVSGLWVTFSSNDREEAFEWARRTVAEFRQVKEFGRSGFLGCREKPWSPQW